MKGIEKIKKYGRKIIFILITIVIIYIVGSCLLPPLFAKDDTTEQKIELSEQGTERVGLIDDNDDTLLWRLRMIQEAKQEIILTTFELRDDTSGEAIMAALISAAERNVTVKVLIDGIDGYLRLHDSENFRAFCAYPNIEVKYYNPFKWNELWKVNYRLHDKYLIVDDTAYILGGRNTHDIYLGHFSQKPQIDRDIVVYEEKSSGAGLLQKLKEYFQKTWELKDCRLLEGKPDKLEREIRKYEMQEHLENLLTQCDYQIKPIDWKKETYQTNGIALLTGNSAVQNKESILWNQMCELMETAQEEVLIQTPLIIYNSKMRDELRQIRKNAGEVEVITNGIENWINLMAADHPYQKEKLLEAGIEVSEYSNKESFHAKTILIDDNISIIGSYNMDLRSAYIDTEIMAAIDCPELNADLRKEIQKLQKQSKTTKENKMELFGEDYKPLGISFKKKCYRVIFGILLHPFQYLL